MLLCLDIQVPVPVELRGANLVTGVVAGRSVGVSLDF